MPLPAVIVETGPDPLGSVIWLHGLGADGHDFEPVVPELRLPRTLPLRFVFPHAPVRPVTVNGGMRMRAWYDIRSFDAEGRADAAGVLESSAQLDQLVAAEIARGLAPGKVLLAGFSQGGAIVLHNVLTSNEPRAGVMALSAYLPLPQHLPGGGAAVAHGGRPPVFMAHGKEDNLVPFEAGRASAVRLSELGFAVEWHEYPIGHGVCPDEIVDIRRWLVGVYGSPSPA